MSNKMKSVVILVVLFSLLMQINTVVILSNKLEELDKRIELNASTGQFDVGAFWGAKATELYIANKQQAAYSDVVLQAKALHSEAVLQAIQNARTPKEEAVAELKDEKNGWWIFGKKKKKDVKDATK